MSGAAPATAALHPLRRRALLAPPLTGLHPVLARIYAARGVRHEAELDHSLRRLLHPRGLGGLAAAARILAQCVRDGGRVLMVGDFDADGATACALMVRGLRAFGARAVDYLVPNRFEFGYGLTREIVDVARRRAPSLIVTVDNGTTSVEGVARAAELGIDVVITDHHLPGPALPRASAIVNPNLPGDAFASKCLAGVGVAFYVLSAVRRQLVQDGWFAGAPPSLAQFLDLVALGTVADVVPLDGNNRVLVAQGLHRISAGACCPGITALLAVAGARARPVGAPDLAFSVAPRLNAAGRLADMSLGIECLLTDDAGRAYELAAQLHELNAERRELQAQMQGEAEAALAGLRLEGELPMALCLYQPGWHPGIVGVVAARVRELSTRPVVAFADAREPGLLRGSARSVPEVHMRDAIERVATAEPGLVRGFGGHAAAAGVTLARAALEPFRAALAHEVAALLEGVALDGALLSDGPIPGEELTLALARALRAAGPWGKDFPEPLFDGEFEVLTSRRVAEAHLRLTVRALDGGPALPAMAFRCAGLAPPGARVWLAYRLEVDEFDGLSRARLTVEQIEYR